MAVERYPADIELTVDDLNTCDWRDVVEDAEENGYSGLWQILSTAAREAIEAGDSRGGKALWLLADACSMMLAPESRNQPLRPFAVFQDRRSVIPEDLDPEDVAFLIDAIPEIDHRWIKARLAEIAWLLGKPRDVQHAQTAIDSYMEIPIEREIWNVGGRECWRRAIFLALSLGKGASDRAESTQAELLMALSSCGFEDEYFALQIAGVLQEFGLAGQEANQVATKLEEFSDHFESTGQLRSARDYAEAASDWFLTDGDADMAWRLKARVADSWIREGTTNASGDPPSNMMAAHCYEKAIQVFRTIPREFRPKHDIEAKIEGARSRLQETNDRALDEFTEHQSPPVDITRLVEAAELAVRGKDVTQALEALTNRHGGPKYSDLRARAIAKIQRYPLQFLFGRTMLSRDGRVIARSDSIGIGGDLEELDDQVLLPEMIQDFLLMVGILVQGDILPAHQAMGEEHRLVEADFANLAKQSPIVPIGREGLVGKGLFQGYDGDYVSAIHILTPQLEHMVRFHLKQAGAITTTISADGIENEIGLKSLMELPEAEQVFGKDLVFEIQALFCVSWGPNLRNELAHGLLEESGCRSIYSVYAWWLMLRLVFNTFWNKARKTADQESSE